MNKDYLSQYVPSFYKKKYGDTNIATFTQELFNQVVNDILSYKFNDWTEKDLLIEKEFKVNEIITSGFKIRDIEFLKAFFLFKGTNSDLQYILNNIGYDSVVYNDGGIYHQKDKDSPMIPVPVQEYKGGLSNCEIEIQIQIDLNNPNWSGGYEGLDTGPIKQIIDERINLCSFLNKVSVIIKADDYVDTDKIYDDITIRIDLPPMEDSIFYEYTLDPILYGREYNDNLKYGGRANKSAPYYGQDKIIFFGPMYDELEITAKREFFFEDQVNINLMSDKILLDEIMNDRIASENIKDSYVVRMEVEESENVEPIIRKIQDLIVYHPEEFDTKALKTEYKALKYHKHKVKYGMKPVRKKYGKQEVLKDITDDFIDMSENAPASSGDKIPYNKFKDEIEITYTKGGNH